ncbi:CRISPR-associated endonuclease Cas2 [Enterococcus sp. AZ192]|uniref:CRISPR-associated endonuclease Cas2 n=1 Tax=unclassified Enterococcus TaxID=2608891 RepID=UPI003D27D177
MLVLITYDVATSSKNGPKRLRKVAKKCQDYGQRVQNSVFECVVDATELTRLKKELIDLIDEEVDSLRIYRLGNNYQTKIEHVGAKESFDVEAPLIF